jgi:hypothetical protein
MKERDDHRSDPEPIDRILTRVLEEAGLTHPEQHVELARAWREVAGPGVRDLTRVVSFRKGIVTIGVESAPLFQELTTYRSDEYSKALRERLGAVRLDELRFRLV